MASKSGKCPTPPSNQQERKKERKAIYHLISKVKLELRVYGYMSSKPTCQETISYFYHFRNAQCMPLIADKGNLHHPSLKWQSQCLPPFPLSFCKCSSLSPSALEEEKGTLIHAGSINCYYLSGGQLATNIRALKMAVLSDPKNYPLVNYPKEIIKDVCPVVIQASILLYRRLRGDV